VAVRRGAAAKMWPARGNLYVVIFFNGIRGCRIESSGIRIVYFRALFWGGETKLVVSFAVLIKAIFNLRR